MGDGWDAVPGVISLDHPAATDPANVGRKAATLARLLAEGFLVPPALVLTTRACQRILEPGPEGLWAETGPVAAAGMPSDVRAALAAAVPALGDIALAVRSSGTVEDLESASFAGQYETVLGVRGPGAVEEAVLACLGSVRSGQLAAYQRRVGRAGPAPMAVLIQRMVEADVAGVAFTADPVSGDRDEVHVSGVRGLARGLVAGEANADTWVIRGERAEHRSAIDGVLDAHLARRVAAVAVEIERVFGAPQDVEWAVADQRVHVLQARPMTALPRPPRIEVPAEGYWEKDDSHYPVPMTAFGASVYLPALEAGLAAQCREFGILAEGEQQRWIGHEVYGRTVPYRGRPWPRWPWWVFGLIARLSPEIRRRSRIAAEAVRSGLAERYLESWDSRDRETLRREASELRAMDLAALDDEALLGHLDRGIDLLRRGEIAHFRLNVPYGLALRDLCAIGRELLGWDPPEVLELLAGSSAISADPGRRLADLARLLDRTAGAREAVAEGGADAVARLRAMAPEAADMLASYIEAYGHRPIGYDPGSPTLAERPDLLLAPLRDRMDSGDRDRHGPPAERGPALERAGPLLALRTAADRERFAIALAAAKRAYPVREETIFFGDSLPSAVLRYTALEIGRRLAERGLLARKHDAVQLTEAELRSALAGGAIDARGIAERRRAERAWVVAHPGPASLGRPEGSPPDPRALPHALRRLNEPWLVPLAGLGPRPATSEANEIAGAPGSPGRYTGAVRIVRDDSQLGRLRPGEVLVCPTASPAWSALFAQAGAVVTDVGSASSHPAIIAREYGIPAVLGTRDATRRLRDGQLVTVDGTAGRVRIASAGEGREQP